MYFFAKVCRLCLSYDSTLVHCKVKDKNNVENYLKIKVVLPELVNKTSQHFPTWICTKCQEQVNQSYEFKQKCYKTYKLLKTYSYQLHEANKDKNIPDVPTEIFQEVKPIIDKNVISIDADEKSENYYDHDDITIVKNELLPNNLKNESEYLKMIDAIILNNFETMKEIHESAADSSLELKRDLNSNNYEQVVQEHEEVSSTVVPDNNNETIETDNLISSPSDQVNESNYTQSSLDATAFTLDYTNASFETFASQVTSNFDITSDYVRNHEEGTARNIDNSSTRVLRRRKSICYKTIAKSFINEDNEMIGKSSLTNANEICAKKIQNKVIGSICDQTVSSSAEIHQTSKNILKNSNSEAKNPSSASTKNVRKQTKVKRATYICEKCSKQYVLYPPFCAHTDKCKGNRPQCTVCLKMFASPVTLRRHSKLHLTIKLNCELCSNQYSTKATLRRHVRSKHNVDLQKLNSFCF